MSATPMITLPEPVPEPIQELPRDGRRYPVPAENEWDNGIPSLAIQDWRRFGTLFAFGRCAVCGCKFRSGELRYRPFAEEDRRNAQLARCCSRDDGPTHYDVRCS